MGGLVGLGLPLGRLGGGLGCVSSSVGSRGELSRVLQASALASAGHGPRLFDDTQCKRPREEEEEQEEETSHGEKRRTSNGSSSNVGSSSKTAAAATSSTTSSRKKGKTRANESGSGSLSKSDILPGDLIGSVGIGSGSSSALSSSASTSVATSPAIHSLDKVENTELIGGKSRNKASLTNLLTC